jgi:L-lactate dehydrogenase complex protein LldF
MAMSEKSSFEQLSRAKAGDELHRRKILKAITMYDQSVAAMKPNQFRDWQQARATAARIKDYTLAHLPQLLETFEANISQRGAKVLWAEDAEEARRHFLEIVRNHQATKVVKAKSMTTEEIELNELLEHNGVEVLESDLGELIVQLAGEKPYHIVTPAMHKSKEDIAHLFHEKLGSPLSASAEELTLVARNHLRDAFVTAQIGVTGANFLIADAGAIIMSENEGNGRLSMSCPKVHVVIAGIEKVLPRLTDLALFLPLLATSGTGQQLTCYSSIVRGPKSDGELDGPEHMYVILLDNGRSKLYSSETFREALRCIRCGACLNACPVYRTIGGYSYGTTYQGPIGSVITPHLRDLERWNHLSFASSLCGACSDSFPVNIGLHHLLIENRQEALKQGRGSLFWKFSLKVWAHGVATRTRTEVYGKLARWLFSALRPLLPQKLRAQVPNLAPKTFAALWKERTHVQP